MANAGVVNNSVQTDTSDLNDRIADVLQSQSPKQALNLLFELQSREQAGPLPPELAIQKQRLKVLAIPILATTEIVTLFKGNLTPVLEFNVGDRLKRRLVSLPTEEQDELKRNILAALELNSQTFVSGAVQSPGQWIELFNQRRGTLAELLKTLPAYAALSPENQLKVERLLKLVQQVSVSSTLPEGIEDEVLIRDETGQFRVLREGRFVEVSADSAETLPALHQDSTGPTPGPMAQPVPVRPPAAPPVAPSPIKLVIEKTAVPLAIKPQLEAPIPQPPTAGGLKPVADFYFHREDEEEINRFRTKMAAAEVPDKVNLELIAAALVDQFKLTFPDEALKGRFISIIVTRLKDVRDLIETKNMLLRPPTVGGVGLPDSLVMPILSQVEEEILRLHKSPPPSLAEPEKKPTPAQPAVPALPVVEKPAAPPVKPVAPPPIQTPPKALPPSPPPQPIEPEKKPIPAQPIVQTRPVPIPPRPTAAAPIVKRPVEAVRPNMSDIRPPVKVFGPVEELKNLAPEDYRRLGKTLAEANEKILEKLDLLEEDSYLKRAEGVKAWKKNLVSKLYLEIGRESMERNMAISDIIRQRQAGGQSTLTEEEFHAVADLNKRMNF